MYSLPPQLIIATQNNHKIREIEAWLKPRGIAAGNTGSFPGLPDINETGQTFYDNALLKARAVWEYTGKAALADDSGLVVPALGGAPGVKSARYAGVGATSQQLIHKLLVNMKAFRGQKRAAYFETVLCLYSGVNQPVIQASGRVHGVITDAAHGDGGFGYDPVFLPDGYTRTFAEMNLAEKNKISHRAQALHNFFAKCKR